MAIPPLIGNPYNGYINPYYWVDDHPLSYGNNGSLDPGTYRWSIQGNQRQLWKWGSEEYHSQFPCFELPFVLLLRKTGDCQVSESKLSMEAFLAATWENAVFLFPKTLKPLHKPNILALQPGGDLWKNKNKLWSPRRIRCQDASHYLDHHLFSRALVGKHRETHMKPSWETPGILGGQPSKVEQRQPTKLRISLQRSCFDATCSLPRPITGWVGRRVSNTILSEQKASEN